MRCGPKHQLLVEARCVIRFGSARHVSRFRHLRDVEVMTVDDFRALIVTHFGHSYSTTRASTIRGGELTRHHGELTILNRADTSPRSSTSNPSSSSSSSSCAHAPTSAGLRQVSSTGTVKGASTRSLLSESGAGASRLKSSGAVGLTPDSSACSGSVRG